MRGQEMVEVDTSTPQVRFGLRARIAEAGNRYYNRFAEKVGTDPATLSRVLAGYQYPSKRLQKALCRELNITLAELKRML